MKLEDARQKIHKAYLMCKETFDPREMPVHDEIEIEDEEELNFYHIVSDFFLQQKQKEVINE